jgi:hypothetical protein
MESITENTIVSKKMLWAGRIMSYLSALFLLFDAIGKLVKPAPVVEATVKLGYPESLDFENTAAIALGALVSRHRFETS